MACFDSEQDRWQAVQFRDSQAHSSFIYAVITTNIFCRPTCPARLARRANVRFFNDISEALKAGFRPCKRCKPDVQGMQLSDGSREIVNKACRFIDDHEGQVVITAVAQSVNISMRHLHNVFKSTLGCTPAVYAAQIRNQKESHKIIGEKDAGSTNRESLGLGHRALSSEGNEHTDCEGDDSPASLLLTETTVTSPDYDQQHLNDVCETFWQSNPIDFSDFELTSLSPVADFAAPSVQDIERFLSSWDQNQIMIPQNTGKG